MFSDSSDDVESQRVTKQLKVAGMSEVEDWFPDELKCCLKVENMPVVSPCETDLTEVEKDLRNSRHIGMRVIPETKSIDDENKFIIVCLTTKSSIYVLEPSVQVHAEFLKEQLNCKDLCFYLLDGLRASFELFKSTGIKIHQLHHVDLEMFDLHLSISSCYIDCLNSSQGFFRTKYIWNYLKPAKKNYYSLAGEYLGIEKKQLKCSREELGHVKTSPLNAVAKNVIKKRASLSRILALKMLEVYHERRNRPSRNIYAVALKSDQEREALDVGGTSSYGQVFI